jgi:ABC-type antimicrobial peptide transport system permease subunit
LALALAILGTYALLAYEVSIREREIGIRLALGSTRSAIVSLLVRQEVGWIGGGIVLGLFGAVLVAYLLRAEFFHARAASMPVLISSSLLLVLPALAAVATRTERDFTARVKAL